MDDFGLPSPVLSALSLREPNCCHGNPSHRSRHLLEDAGPGIPATWVPLYPDLGLPSLFLSVPLPGGLKKGKLNVWEVNKLIFL